MSKLGKLFLNRISDIKYARYGKPLLSDMLFTAGVPISSLSKSIIPLLNHPVKQVSFAGKRMIPDSLAFGLFAENPELMKNAMNNGAFAVVVEKEIPGIPCIVVKDPTLVYAKMCSHFRKFYPQVKTTAVTGSIGKTTVKNMVAAVYKEQYHTLTEPLNENEPDIVGFTAQHLSSRIEQWVQEIAESVPGSTKSMSLILEPDIVIITTLDKSHIGRLGSMDTILEEVCGLAEYLSDDGIVIVNKDEFTSYQRLEGKRITTISMSDPSADYIAADIIVREDGLHFQIVENSSQKPQPISIHLNNIFAKHNALNALYAYAAGRHSGISSKLIARGLENYRTTGYRNNVYKSPSGKDIIYADCYNAVGRSIRAALEAASLIPLVDNGIRIAVLGDVKELDKETIPEHLDILKSVNESCFEKVLLYGDILHSVSDSFHFRDGLNVSFSNTIDDIVRELKPYIDKGNLFLFKSSHSGHLEDCIQKLWPKLFKEKEKEEIRKKTKWKIQVLLP